MVKVMQGYLIVQVIQVGAAKLLSMLLQMAEPHPFANSCFGLDDKQVGVFFVCVWKLLICYFVMRLLNNYLFSF